MTGIAQITATTESPLQTGVPAGQAEPASTKPIKLDWSRVAPPRNLESARVEELSIDGICGVY